MPLAPGRLTGPLCVMKALSPVHKCGEDPLGHDDGAALDVDVVLPTKHNQNERADP